MTSAATWSDAGRLRVAEPALARRASLHRQRQQRVLSQVAKLLEYIRPFGMAECGIAMKSPGDATITTVHSCLGSMYSIDENRRGSHAWRLVLLESVEEVLRFLSSREIVELRLISTPYLRTLGTLDVAFQGDGLDTVVWDTYQPPEWAVSSWQQRLWKLLTYIQTSPSLTVEPDVLKQPFSYVKWTGDRFQTKDGETADIRQLIDGSRPSTMVGLRSDTCTLHFHPPNYSNPWN